MNSWRSLSVMARLASVRKGITSSSTTRLMSSHPANDYDLVDPKNYPPGLHPSTMDDHPVPRGPWEDHNAKMQSKYNRHLAVGLVVFIGTFTYLMNCPEVDFVMAPKSIGKNPPGFSALHP